MKTAAQQPWMKTLRAAAALSADTNVDFTIPNDIDDMKLIFVVTSPTGTTETLDIAFQTSPDGGTNYFTHSGLTQITTSAVTRVLDVSRSNHETSVQDLVSTALGTTNGSDPNSAPWSRYGRIRMDVGGTNPGYVVAIYAIGTLNH